MAGKSRRIISNPGQILKNHQNLTGKIGKGESQATFIALQY